MSNYLNKHATVADFSQMAFFNVSQMHHDLALTQTVCRNWQIQSRRIRSHFTLWTCLSLTQRAAVSIKMPTFHYLRNRCFCSLMKDKEKTGLENNNCHVVYGVSYLSEHHSSTPTVALKITLNHFLEGGWADTQTLCGNLFSWLCCSWHDMEKWQHYPSC